MKKRALCALVSLALCVTLAGQAAAAESSVSFVVNGITLVADVPNRVEARTTYVSYWPIVSALYPNATAEWVNGQAEVKADGLTLHIKPGAQYIEANGRYLYVPDGVKCEGYSIMVPIRTLCQALGAGVEWDGTQSTIQITSGSGPILSGEQAYQADVVYWLSRIIYAESGNQPLDGKIAVTIRPWSGLWPWSTAGFWSIRSCFNADAKKYRQAAAPDGTFGYGAVCERN